jgi:hypothetical protein
MFNQVLVTEELYGYDDKDEAGIIVASKGDIKPYQTVVAVGDDVKKVKPGDVVAINFYKYAEFKENPNSVKAMGGNRMVSLHLNEVELVDENDEVVRCFIIDERDVKYILVDFDEVTYNKDDELIEVPKLNLILPNNKFRT